ncbi:MAG: ABC transporter substrate-binding protein [Deferrisomatales bacterium]
MVGWLCALLVLGWLGGGVASGSEAPTVAGYSREEALRLGERMYREGLLPDGRPMTAFVMGDIPVDGRMFTCDDCHQRSGIGSKEGRVIVYPTNGKELYQPRRRNQAYRVPRGARPGDTGQGYLPDHSNAPDARPAYTDETLALALRVGVDPTGRKLDYAMPRYVLGDRAMAVMIHYLKNLSSEPAPGVDGSTLHFATVVSHDVPPADREAMLACLRAHVEAHNAQYRHEERRAQWGVYYHTEKNVRYRRWELDVWELQGPRDTWRSQLESYYRAKPVFALIGGVATGSWEPIHRFCEEHQLPCVLPITDLPVISETDWYTLYFSKGFYQEGEGAAKYLHAGGRAPQDVSVVQVVRKGERGAVTARGFREMWERLGHPPPAVRELPPDGEVAPAWWNELGSAERPLAVLLWLETGVEEALEALSRAARRPALVFVSSSLLGPKLASIPDDVRDRVYLTYPRALPGENETRRDAVRSWLRARKIPLTNMDIQSKMMFLGFMWPMAVAQMRSEFFREYFLEQFDMMIDQTYTIAVYPRLTFGPGQRYASKGCYIVQLTNGPAPVFLKRGDWVTH